MALREIRDIDHIWSKKAHLSQKRFGDKREREELAFGNSWRLV